jgi:hypothetical protein
MSQNNSSHHPAFIVHQAFEKFGQNVNNGIQELQHNLGINLGELTSGAARVVHHFQQQISSHLSAPLDAPQMAFAVSII